MNLQKQDKSMLKGMAVNQNGEKCRWMNEFENNVKWSAFYKHITAVESRAFPSS